MLEILQWLLLLGLGVCAGWFWRDRSLNRPPDWLAGIDEEDLVRQADLDQYHHRVVQLSHAQRDLLTKRIEDLEGRLREFERPAASFPSSPVKLDIGETPAPLLDRAPDPPVACESTAETPAAQPTPEPVSQEAPTDPFDSTARVLRLWREGRPVDEIARDLRMGRQEVQLLIEMSRHSAVVTRA